MNIYLLTFLIVFVLVALMEIVRRLVSKIQKEWVKTLINTVVGLVLSFAFALLAYYCFDFYQIGSPWAIILYTLGLFFAQKDLDKSILKPILNKLAEKVAK